METDKIIDEANPSLQVSVISQSGGRSIRAADSSFHRGKKKLPPSCASSQANSRAARASFRRRDIPCDVNLHHADYLARVRG